MLSLAAVHRPWRRKAAQRVDLVDGGFVHCLGREKMKDELPANGDTNGYTQDVPEVVPPLPDPASFSFEIRS